jgi:serine protease AprX
MRNRNPSPGSESVMSAISPRRHRGLRNAVRRRVATSLIAASVAAGSLVATSPASAAVYDPATDLFSMAAVTAQTGATAWWNAGYTGRGVDVAVIDTGVAPVAGLNGAGKIVHGPDLSLESQAPNLRNLDTNGHGTFMAGMIAGKDSTLTTPYANAPATAYRGIAPDARIVSIKVGTADGGVDVSQVIAAINWIVQHKNDNGMNIRVLNLSYGTNSTQSAGVDPLSYAVEQAWKKGIVVVAAAGNTGYQRGSGAPGLANPAYNPYVLAVGGYDSNGTAVSSDDTIGSYSASSAGCGAVCKNPDVVAPGSHAQGLRVPNGYLDATHPGGRIGTRYFRGSGTSQAAAITSGMIALVLQKHPTLTPDQVKRFLKDNAKKVPGADSQAQGSGEINLTSMASKTPAAFTQNLTPSTGTGTLEGARGADHLTANGVTLTGEKDIFGKPFNSAAIAIASAAGSTWSGGTWNGSTWSGSSWSGSTWSGSTWSGSTWSGSTWSGSTWSGSTWSGSTWSGSTWSGSSWSGSTWSGSTWSGGSWS